ncbi:glycosyltransferase family 2 protein [Candidatus Daviesbacteria bacterium]|nr:glycosyltransferase family 2 protein [Candidatus Daviesbacteria bacterium]
MDLSIIILSFNTKDIIDECLSRVKKAKEFAEKNLKSEIEVIVVENASSDGSKEMLESRHGWVRLIISKTNTGFSGGNNIGMKASRGKFILLLNSDCFVVDDTLVKSLEYFKNHPEVDLIGPRLNFKDGRLQPSAGYLPTPLNTILWISGLARFPLMDQIASPIHPKDSSFFSKERKVQWVMGAYFMFKREVYDATNGFDESIFMYGEEVEWCKRIKDQGFGLMYVPSIEVTHIDKASSKGELKNPLLSEIKAIVRYYRQHYKDEYPFVKLVMVISLIFRAFLFAILGKKDRKDAYLEALGVL